MSDYKKDHSVTKYTCDGKTYFEVAVQKRDKFGRLRKTSSRFTKSGKRITSQASVTQVKLRLIEELKILIGQQSTYTWQDWKRFCILKMRNQGLKEGTIETYDKHVDRWKDDSWSGKFLNDLTRDDVFDYFHGFLVKKGASDWTRRNLHKRIHRIFEMAVDEGQISRNPARGIKISAKSDEGVALTPSEVETLLTKARLTNHSYYPHWVVALLTGLRNGELYALKYDKIDFDSNTILINEQFTSKDGLHLPKKGKVRTIDLGLKLKNFLLHLRETIGPQSATLWKYGSVPIEVDEIIGGIKTGRKIPGSSKEKEYVQMNDLVLPRIRSWTMGNQAKELREFCQKIGIREAKFHDLRATHITNLLSNGNSISKVMNQVGHSKMATTDSYNRRAGVEIKGITESLDFDVPKVNESNDEDNVVHLFSKRVTS